MRHLRKAVVLGLLLASTALAQVMTPVITSLNPTSIIAGSPELVVRVTGANFVAGAQVRLNGSNRQTRFVDSRNLDVTLFASDLTQPRTHVFTALNPGTQPSAGVNFQVVSNVPVITSINPEVVAVGSNSFLLTVTGTGFSRDFSMIRINNNLVETTFVSDTQLTTTISASELNQPRTLNISVFNAPPINTTSNTVTLSVRNDLAPVISLIDPDEVIAGSPGFTLNVFGMNFAPNSVIRVNGAVARTTFVSSTRLTTDINDFQLVSARVLTITVQNPTTNLTSDPVTLTVVQATIPVVDSITPSSVQAASGAFTISVTGDNFTTRSIVQFDGIDRVTTFVDSRHLTARINSNDVAVEGTHQISVENPPPNGGTSNSVTLLVFAQLAPIVTAVNPPNFATASPSLKLTVTGSRFGINEENVVLVDGTPRATEFVNNTTLVATLLPSDVAVAGTHVVTVTNRNGLTSAPITFTVSSETGPLISTLDPASVVVGTQPFTLTLNGLNFFPGSIVLVDNTPRATTFVSPTQLTVPITAADVASAREISLVVLNDDGKRSQPVKLFVALQAPTITSLSPPRVTSGDVGFTLVISGTGFDANSVVRLDNAVRASTFDPATGTLSVTLDATELVTPRTIDVSVTGVGGTATASLQVVRPQITSVDPASIQSGASNVTLTVSGNAFLPTSRIVYLGTVRETTFNAATGTLSTTLSASDLAISGQTAILVQNTPQSVSAPFLINIASIGEPRIDALNPSTILVGGTSATVTVTGANFLSGAIVRVNGIAKPTQFVSSTRLIVTLNSDDLAIARTLILTVTNPEGGMSGAASLTISNSPPPPPGPRRRGVRP
jgi:hypothetical protein